MFKLINMISIRNILIISILFLGIVTRIIPHPPNFTPILSITLLSGFYIKKQWGFMLPLIIIIVSNILLNLFGIQSPNLYVYLSILLSLCLIYLMGFYFLKDNITTIIKTSFFSSVIFFLVTNFSVWFNCYLSGIGIYSPDLSGLLLCYEAAIPFFKYTLISTFSFSIYFYLVYKFMRFYENEYSKIIV